MSLIQRTKHAKLDPQHKSQFHFKPNTEIKLVSVSTLKLSQLRDPDKKTGKFRPVHYSEVNFDPPHWNHVILSTNQETNQVWCPD